MNSRPLAPNFSGSKGPAVFTQSVLLTQKMDTMSANARDFDVNDLSKKHWKTVQCPVDAFWCGWGQIHCCYGD